MQYSTLEEIQNLEDFLIQFENEVSENFVSVNLGY